MSKGEAFEGFVMEVLEEKKSSRSQALNSLSTRLLLNWAVGMSASVVKLADFKPPATQI